MSFDWGNVLLLLVVMAEAETPVGPGALVARQGQCRVVVAHVVRRIAQLAPQTSSLTLGQLDTEQGSPRSCTLYNFYRSVSLRLEYERFCQVNWGFNSFAIPIV